MNFFFGKSRTKRGDIYTLVCATATTVVLVKRALKHSRRVRIFLPVNPLWFETTIRLTRAHRYRPLVEVHFIYIYTNSKEDVLATAKAVFTNQLLRADEVVPGTSGKYPADLAVPGLSNTTTPVD